MLLTTFQQQLESEADSLYVDFMLPLFPGLQRPMLGVRMPRLREMARELVKEDWKNLYKEIPNTYYEHQVLKGLMIGYADLEWHERLGYIQQFVSTIDNWGVCDSFVSSLKAFQHHLDEGWEFLQPFAKSGLPYEQRFAAVMFLWYYITPERIEKVLEALMQIKALKYYARMGVGWALCECFLVAPEKTYPYVIEEYFSAEIKRIARKKILESLRTPPEWRARLKATQ